MGVGTSIVTIAVGAILDFAVKVHNSHGFNVNRIGLILIIVGIVGLVISLFFWASWGGFGTYRRRRVVSNPGRRYIDSSGREVVEQPGSSYVEDQQERY